MIRVRVVHLENSGLLLLGVVVALAAAWAWVEHDRGFWASRDS